MPLLKGLEARREHDFHRYLDAELSISGSVPTYCDLNDAAAVQAHEPVPSPDQALTAFCQLAALRLRTRRAMLFFFDVTHAFVLAEATRSLPIASDDIDDASDPLWLGFTAIPRGFSVCEQSISIFGSPLTAATRSKPVTVISDLREDTRFCGRPYVQDSPNARFYAGVPITSPEGINIGAFCVLDDAKRPDLTAAEQDFMRDMSSTIMTHLTLVRATAEQKRETRMVTALGKFVQESSCLRESNQADDDETVASKRRRSSSQSSEETLVDETCPSLPRTPDEIVKKVEKRPSKDLLRAASSPDRIQTPSQSSKAVHRRLSNLRGEVRQSPDDTPSPPLANATRSVADDLRKEAIPNNIRSTFQRAAGQVRDAIGVDGVVFLDASIGTFGGLVEARSPVFRRGSDGVLANCSNTAGQGTVLWSDRGIVSPTPCHILGSSLSNDMAYGETNITEPLLEGLLNKYPLGKIWTFEGQGSECEADSPDSANEGHPFSESKRTSSSSSLANDRWERRAHADEIQRLFPRVRSFGFVGMWDHVRQRWFAGCVFWTSSPFRVLSVESELRYISAFCDVIMTETKRLEVERSDRAKMDFLSSISHELRSPLHGILGSTECLQENPMDVTTELLVSQIESCGRTLLDIIDHLLEYSRINFYTRNASSGSNKEGNKPPQTGNVSAKQFQHLGRTVSEDADVALDRITEEVIDAAVFSFFSGRDNSTKHNVSVMMDIEDPGSPRWNCQVTSGGWKRVCMNIVTNALKYTHRGYIHIGLKTALIPNSNHQLAAVFSVSDTGQGMSREFLKNHLFRAFSQEDYLSSGIGLGMNLVAKIIHAFGGKIDVQSERSVGTCITVFMPLQQRDTVQKGQNLTRQAKLQSIPSRALIGVVDGTAMQVQSAPKGMPERDAAEQQAHALLLATLEKSCSQLGQQTCRLNLSAPCTTQLNIMAERDLTQALRSSQREHLTHYLGRRPLIVICESSQSERRLRKAQISIVPGQIVEYLAPPCGPAKVRKAITSCLARQPSMPDSTVSGASIEDALIAPAHDIKTNGRTHQAPQSHPTKEMAAEAVLLPSRPASPLIKSKPEDGLVLLLVDDNQINLQLLKTYATKRGHPQLVAMNGIEAVQAYKDAHATGVRPNVILMDINMPLLDGYEATRRIRAYEQDSGLEPTTVIALTGLGSADAQREAYTCGFDLFLTKPVQLKKLTALLDSVKAKRGRGNAG